MFVTTANTLDTIPGPLRDRMEVIQLAGYTEEEKLEIAKRYLVPRQIERNGLSRAQIAFTDAALRGRHRRVHARGRRAQPRARDRRDLPQGRAPVRRGQGASASVTVGPRSARASCSASAGSSPRRGGAPREPGVATGLAWTPAGGDVLFVEATAMPGSGKLTITGQLGDVMKESAQAALSYVRAHAGELAPELPEDWFATPRPPRPRAGGRDPEGRPERGHHDGDRAGVAAHAAARCATTSR